MKLLITNGTVLREGNLVPADILCEDGKILGIGAGLAQHCSWDETFDAQGLVVLPGFVDGHIHGAAGGDAADLEGIRAMSAMLASHGVTAFLPTLASETPEDTRAGLQAIAQSMQEKLPGARVLGAHMEGPFLAANCKGAMDERNFLLPTVENFEKLTGEWAPVVRRMTLDPAQPGAIDFIRWLTARGISVSIGHSEASAATVTAALAAGACSVTHLFNAMPSLHHRNPGVIGAALSDPRATVELIADYVHVDPVALKVALAAKGADGVMLVSDALQAAGMPDGDYQLGEVKVYVRDGVARIAAGNLAGSTLLLDRALRNVAALGHSLPAAAHMAATSPARVCGAADRGRIALGLAADFALLDADLTVAATVVGGSIVYSAGNS